MAQTYTQTQSEAGAKAEMPAVTVENCGNFTLKWTCQNYVAGKDLNIILAPGEKDKFDYDYARRVFGDWEVDPFKSPESRIEWNGMIAYTKRRSPSKDGKLPQVKVYDQSGNVLWDTAAQMEEWLKHNAASPEAFAPPPNSPLGPLEMPEVLEKAGHKELKALWLKAFGSKMPAGTKGEVAKLAIMPHLTAGQITTELKEFYSTPAPDMSQHRK
jgi:hypothetical protein